MGEGFDIYTLIFLALAVFIFFRLRSVLGQRTGNEPPPERIRRRDAPPAATPGDKVIALPPRGAEADRAAKPQGFRWQGIAAEGSELAAGLDAIAAADPSFDAATFTKGARAAYEMIVSAFNEGDRKSLKGLLSRDVFDSFATAIGERESRGETVEGKFVSIDKAEIRDAQMKGRTAHVAVAFLSQMITATRDKAGEVIDGSTEKITEVTDVWTFARDTTASDPNWRLVATEEA